MNVPSFGVVTHAVGHDPMPFATCLSDIADATGEHLLLLASPAGPVIQADGVSAVGHYPNLLASDPRAVLRMTGAAGLRIGSVLPLVPVKVGSQAEVDTTIAAFAPWIAATAALGGDSFTISAPRGFGPDGERAEREEALRRLAHVMDRLAEAGGGDTFTVAVDIHLGSLVESLADARVLVEAMRHPGAGLLLNIGHLTTCRQNGWELIERYPERIHVVGWKDHSLAEDRPNPVYSVELGTADSPFARYIRAFKASGDTHAVHFVNVEHPPAGDEVPTLRRSLAYLRHLWEATA